MSIFEKFNKSVDLKGIKADITEAANNVGANRPDVPLGTYEVSIDKLELTVSKKGDPMLTCWFNILEGSFKNSKIFMNQVITRGFQIHIANEFLRSLETGVDVEFIDYVQYENLVSEVADATGDYQLNYGENNKGFNIFEIEEVFE